MTHDISTSSAPSLAETDAKFIQGVFLIKDAVLEYAQVHKLNARQIGEHVRGLGASQSNETIRRWIKGFKAQGLLEEKAPSQTPEAVRQRKHRESVTNPQNVEMSQPTERYDAPPEPIEQEFQEIFEGFANIAQASAEDHIKEMSYADQHTLWCLGKWEEIYDPDWLCVRDDAEVTVKELKELANYWHNKAEANAAGRAMDNMDRMWDKDHRPIDVIRKRIPLLTDEEKQQLLNELSISTQSTNVQDSILQLPHA